MKKNIFCWLLKATVEKSMIRIRGSGYHLVTDPEHDFISTSRCSDNRPIYVIQLQLRRVILGSPTRTGSSSTTHSKGLKVRPHDDIILLMFFCCQMDQQNHKFFYLFLLLIMKPFSNCVDQCRPEHILRAYDNFLNNALGKSS